jgi:RNA polymerase sigma-70 factor (sigma-E family)
MFAGSCRGTLSVSFRNPRVLWKKNRRLGQPSRPSNYLYCMGPEAGTLESEVAVSNVGAGENAILADLFRQNYPSLVRIALAMTADRDLAQELAQEAFVRAMKGLPRLRDSAAAPAYLRRTLINLTRHSFRRRLLELRPLPRAEVGSEPDHIRRLTVVEALRDLPPRQRACIALRYYEDLSEAETARILGISVGTVKSQTHKALRRLRPVLEVGDE